PAWLGEPPGPWRARRPGHSPRRFRALPGPAPAGARESPPHALLPSLLSLLSPLPIPTPQANPQGHRLRTSDFGLGLAMRVVALTRTRLAAAQAAHQSCLLVEACLLQKALFVAIHGRDVRLHDLCSGRSGLLHGGHEQIRDLAKVCRAGEEVEQMDVLLVVA